MTAPNRIKTIALSAAALLTAAIYATWAVNYSQRRRRLLADNRQTAAMLFRQSLQDEVRQTQQFPFTFHRMSHFYRYTDDTLRAKAQRSSLEGTRVYHTTATQRAHNLCTSAEQAIMMRLSLETFPLNLDTLNRLFDARLQQAGIKATTQLRYSGPTSRSLFADTTAYSKGGRLTMSAADSLTSLYIGHCCEDEYTVFMSSRAAALSHAEWWLPLPLLLLVMLAALRDRIFTSAPRPGQPETATPAPDAQLRPVICRESPSLYRLGNDIYFHSDKQELRTWQRQQRLMPQTAILLKALLESQSARLTADDINRELWGGRGTDDTIYAAVSRLRRKLEKGFGHTIVKNGRGEYVLISKT